MHCPSCTSLFQRLEFHGIEIDQCRLCRGVWMDHGEIDQIFALRKIPDRLVNHEVYREPPMEVPEGERLCPRCDDLLAVIEVDGIRLDACPECKGFFADIGEIKRLSQAAEQRFQDEQRS